MGLDDKKQQRQIGGVTYDMNPVGFAIGRPMLMRLVGVISPLLAAAAHGAAGVFEVLPQYLKDDDLKYLAKHFGDSCWYYQEGNPQPIPLVEINQNEHFAGRYLEFMQWLTFGCEVNFKSFFSGIKTEAEKLAAMIPKEQSRSKSIPGSG